MVYKDAVAEQAVGDIILRLMSNEELEKVLRKIIREETEAEATRTRDEFRAQMFRTMRMGPTGQSKTGSSSYLGNR